MKIEKETLEGLDELNLLTLLEKISVGNIARGYIWLVDSAKKAKDFLASLEVDKEKPEEKEKENKTRK